MPSSLTRVFSRVLVFSTHPPVSVYGTGSHKIIPRSFSRECDIIILYLPNLTLFHVRICLHMTLDPLSPIHLGADVSLLFHSFQSYHWCRNLYLLSIGYALQPHLRTRLTQGGRTFPWKPWVFDGQDSHLSFRYLHRHSHF